MSQLTVTKCDSCEKRTDDYFSEVGWVVFDGSLSTTQGRDKKRNAKTHYKQGKFHFCSIQCLLSFLKLN